MSNVKKCGVVGIHMLDMFARLCARNQMTDVSVEVYCRHSPIIGYTRSSIVHRNEVYRFSRNFSRYIFGA